MIGRYVRLTAKEGQGDALAEKMLAVADGLAGVAGCELYVINRSPEEADVVWVTERWRSQEDLDASLEEASASSLLPEVMALLDGQPERIEVEPVGGVGVPRGGQGFTHVNLGEVEDQAPKFGYGEFGEARFARGALDAAATGVSLQRLRPGVRQAFAHRHRSAEEVYVVLSGSGRMRIDDEEIELSALDAVRIAPGSARQLEAGPDGLEVLALGAAYHMSDAELVRDFWT